jgi:hypothetical protein
MVLKAKQPMTGGFEGTLSVKKFDLKDPGFLAQAVSILGLMDGIRGKDMRFNKMEVPFEMTPWGTIEIADGYAAGNSLGVSFRGTIGEQLALQGSVIPAYAINSGLGRIPLIGGLFRDGQGGGLFGVRYTTTGTPLKPNVSFEPLKSLAPGALGKIFN